MNQRSPAAKPDLLDGLRSAILEAIPTTTSSDRAALLSLDTRDLVVRFINWRDRLIHPHPREIRRSLTFNTDDLFLQNRDDVNLLLAKLASGQDVNSHLSERVLHGYKAPHPSGTPGKDLDLLLNDWGIHHLHLGHVPWRNGFTARSEPLLFVVVQRHTVFALAVMGHRLWTKESLVEAAVRSWPGRIFQPIDAIPQSGGQYSEGDRKMARDAGISLFVRVDDNTYTSPMGGLSAARTSSRATIEANRIIRTFRDLQKAPQTLTAQLKQSAHAAQRRWPRRPDIRVRIAAMAESYDILFEEQQSGACVTLPAVFP
jgi:hypothetical protein